MPQRGYLFVVYQTIHYSHAVGMRPWFTHIAFLKANWYDRRLSAVFQKIKSHSSTYSDYVVAKTNLQVGECKVPPHFLNLSPIRLSRRMTVPRTQINRKLLFFSKRGCQNKRLFDLAGVIKIAGHSAPSPIVRSRIKKEVNTSLICRSKY